MSSETRTCQNCKNQFTIEPEDFQFYEKIKVPPPTFCPECRFQRRLALRNERNLYRRQCGLCGKKMISMYSSEKPFPVYCRECWWGDKWDPMQFGIDYSFSSKPFFLQFRELQEKVPRPNLISSNATNSDYCNYFAGGKNCYLCFGSIEVEDCLYGSPYGSRYCVDTFLARDCEYCYECIDCEKLSNSLYAQECSSSLNLFYCFDCKNCQDCIGCVGLRNKKYCIFNKQYSKEDYKKEKENIYGDGRNGLERVRTTYEELKKSVPHKFAMTLQCIDISGDHVFYSKNSHECFDIKKCQDSKYSMRMMDGKNVYDTNYCEYLELCCDYLGFWKVSNTKFSNTCGESSYLTYADFCSNSNNLFGCVGVRNKSYCIFNKQYSKEEYEILVPKIIAHMKEVPYVSKNGVEYRYGEYFPIDLSLVAYNETVAQEFFPLSKDVAENRGYAWKLPEDREYKVTIKNSDVPNKVSIVADSITNEIIECVHRGNCNDQCTTAFKIIEPELQFYRRMNIPLPVLCPNCRHYKRLQQRNPFKLWSRKCQCQSVDFKSSVYKNSAQHFHGVEPCPNEFKTSYSPDRPEIIYCEQCYQAEVA